MDKFKSYSGDEIRTALVQVSRRHPELIEPLLEVAVELGLDTGDHGDVVAGWAQGTKAPPPGGFVPDAPMVGQ